MSYLLERLTNYIPYTRKQRLNGRIKGQFIIPYTHTPPYKKQLLKSRSYRALGVLH